MRQGCCWSLASQCRGHFGIAVLTRHHISSPDGDDTAPAGGTAVGPASSDRMTALEQAVLRLRVVFSPSFCAGEAVQAGLMVGVSSRDWYRGQSSRLRSLALNDRCGGNRRPGSARECRSSA